MWTFIKEKIKIYYNSLRRVCQRYILAERVILKTYLIINTFWSLLFWNKSRQAIKYEYNSQIYFSYIYDCKLKEDDRYLWQIFFCWAAFLFSNVFNVSKKTFDDFLKVIPCFYLELEPAWYKLHGTSPFKDISSYMQARLMTSVDLLVGTSALPSGLPHCLSLHRPVKTFQRKTSWGKE